MAGVAGHGRQANGTPGSQQKRHNSMNTIMGPRKVKRPTAAQDRAWASFGGGSCGWGHLTEDQYRAWEVAAKKEKRRRRWPRDRRFTGQNLFTEINSHQSFLGLPPYLYPPEHPAFDLYGLGPLMAGNGLDGFTLKLGVPKVPAGHTLVFGSPPCPPGRRVCRDFRFLGLLPPPDGGMSDITRRYVEKFGNPRAGSRIFIRTWQQVDGWRDSFPTQTTAVIPGKPDPADKRVRRRASGVRIQEQGMYKG